MIDALQKALVYCGTNGHTGIDKDGRVILVISLGCRTGGNRLSMRFGNALCYPLWCRVFD